MNNKLLIDSHILIWLLYEPEKITPQVGDLLQKADTVYLSVVSLWELALKFNKKKLAYAPADLMEGAHALNLEQLSLKDEHILAMLDIRLAHKDPFDSILIAQSEAEGCTFITADGQMLASTYTTFGCV